MKPGLFCKATQEFMGFKYELQRTSIAKHLSIQKKNPVLAPLTVVAVSIGTNSGNDAFKKICTKRFFKRFLYCYIEKT